MLKNIETIPLFDSSYQRIPKMACVRQKLERNRIDNIENHLYSILKQFPCATDLVGKRIAVTAGSRGIHQIDKTLKTIIQFLQKQGAKPFIVPAMGSHGNATREGQIELLASYGITESSMGVPLEATMEVVEVGRTTEGLPVYCNRIAREADGVILCNRIKAHSDFKGDYESGLIKMLVVGLGNHVGASSVHQQGFGALGRILPEAGALLLKALPVIFGVAIVENAYDETMILEAIAPEDIFPREKDLLKIAKKVQAKLPFDAIDVLIVDEIGKNISGAGIDPNVTGRPGSGLPGFQTPAINKIIIRDLTEASHGNAIGIGLADITTKNCLAKINFNAMYTNATTATVLASAKLPVVTNSDREAIALAIQTCNKPENIPVTVVRIKNTLELDRFYVSESIMDQASMDSFLELEEDFECLQFDSDGFLC